MKDFFRRWWVGTTEIQYFDNDPDSYVQIFPLVRTRHHWTARLARAVVRFLLNHWQFAIGTVIGLIGIWVSWLSLK